jgi:hypothetical protein
MNRRRWTIRTRILTLLFAPLVPLLAMLIFATTTALAPALNLRDANIAAVVPTEKEGATTTAVQLTVPCRAWRSIRSSPSRAGSARSAPPGRAKRPS